MTYTCEACGRELVVASTRAAVRARLNGWTVRGARRAKRTRCPHCIAANRRGT